MYDVELWDLFSFNYQDYYYLRQSLVLWPFVAWMKTLYILKLFFNVLFLLWSLVVSLTCDWGQPFETIALMYTLHSTLINWWISFPQTRVIHFDTFIRIKTGIVKCRTIFHVSHPTPYKKVENATVHCHAIILLPSVMQVSYYQNYCFSVFLESYYLTKQQIRWEDNYNIKEQLLNILKLNLKLHHQILWDIYYHIWLIIW
jgi:hypothetical protein